MPVQPQLSREAIFGNLFLVLKTITLTPPIMTFSRRFYDWSSYPVDSQPALLMLQGKQRSESTMRALVRWRMYADVLFYFVGPSIIAGQSGPPWPVTQANDFVDAVEEALSTKNPDGSQLPFGEPQTLGGLVTDCCVIGEVLMNQDAFDVPGSQGVVLVPIEILVGE